MLNKKDIKSKTYEEAKEEYLSKYRGAFTGGANAEEEYNKYRLEKFGDISKDNKTQSREERLEKYTNSGISALRGEELEEARFKKYKK